MDKDNKSIDAQTASLDDYSNKVFDDVVKGFIDDEKYQRNCIFLCRNVKIEMVYILGSNWV